MTSFGYKMKKRIGDKMENTEIKGGKFKINGLV